MEWSWLVQVYDTVPQFGVRLVYCQKDKSPYRAKSVRGSDRSVAQIELTSLGLEVTKKRDKYQTDLR